MAIDDVEAQEPDETATPGPIDWGLFRREMRNLQAPQTWGARVARARYGAEPEDTNTWGNLAKDIGMQANPILAMYNLFGDKDTLRRAQVRASKITQLPGVHGGLTALDTLARPVRTLLYSGDPGLAFDSITNPDLAPDATAIRRKYLFNDIGQREGEMEFADLADVGMDLAIGIFTDPLTYIGGPLGLAKGAGKAVQGAALAGRRALVAGKGLEAVDDIIKSAAKVGIKLTPEEAVDRMLGRQKMFQELRTGERKLFDLSIPFTNKSVDVPGGKLLAAPVEAITNIRSALGKTAGGKALGTLLDKFSTFSDNPGLDQMARFAHAQAMAKLKQPLVDAKILYDDLVGMGATQEDLKLLGEAHELLPNKVVASKFEEITGFKQSEMKSYGIEGRSRTFDDVMSDIRGKDWYKKSPNAQNKIEAALAKTSEVYEITQDMMKNAGLSSSSLGEMAVKGTAEAKFGLEDAIVKASGGVLPELAERNILGYMNYAREQKMPWAFNPMLIEAEKSFKRSVHLLDSLPTYAAMAPSHDAIRAIVTWGKRDPTAAREFINQQISEYTTAKELNAIVQKYGTDLTGGRAVEGTLTMGEVAKAFNSGGLDGVEALTRSKGILMEEHIGMRLADKVSYTVNAVANHDLQKGLLDVFGMSEPKILQEKRALLNDLIAEVKGSKDAKVSVQALEDHVSTLINVRKITDPEELAQEIRLFLEKSDYMVGRSIKSYPEVFGMAGKKIAEKLIAKEGEIAKAGKYAEWGADARAGIKDAEKAKKAAGQVNSALDAKYKQDRADWLDELRRDFQRKKELRDTGDLPEPSMGIIKGDVPPYYKGDILDEMQVWQAPGTGTKAKIGLRNFSKMPETPSVTVDGISFAARDKILNDLAHRLGIDIRMVDFITGPTGKLYETAAGGHFVPNVILVKRAESLGKELQVSGHEVLHDYLSELAKQGKQNQVHAILDRIIKVLKDDKSWDATLETVIRDWGENINMTAQRAKKYFADPTERAMAVKFNEKVYSGTEEMLAEATGRALANPAFLKSIGVELPASFAARVYAWIKAKLDAVTSALGRVSGPARGELERIGESGLREYIEIRKAVKHLGSDATDIADSVIGAPSTSIMTVPQKYPEVYAVGYADKGAYKAHKEFLKKTRDMADVLLAHAKTGVKASEFEILGARKEMGNLIKDAARAKAYQVQDEITRLAGHNGNPEMYNKVEAGVPLNKLSESVTKGKVIPGDVALALKRTQEHLRDASYYHQLFEHWHHMNKTWKTITMMGPGPLSRNLIGNFMNRLQGGGWDVKSISDQVGLYKMMDAMDMPSVEGRKLLQSQQFTIGAETINGEQLVKMAEEYDILDNGVYGLEMSESIKETFAKKIAPVRAVNWYNTKARQLENIDKLGMFVARLRAGDNPALAAYTTNKFLFNYNITSPFVNYMRKSGMMPFAAWSSKNIPLQLSMLIERPAQFAALMHAKQAIEGGKLDLENATLPGYMEDKFNIKLRKNKDGSVDFLTLSGTVPMADLPTVTNVGEFLTNLFGPGPKGILETALNYDFLTKKKIEEIDGEWKSIALPGSKEGLVVSAKKKNLFEEVLPHAYALEQMAEVANEKRTFGQANALRNWVLPFPTPRTFTPEQRKAEIYTLEKSMGQAKYLAKKYRDNPILGKRYLQLYDEMQDKVRKVKGLKSNRTP